MFYAVSRNFAPNGQASNTGCSPSTNCITVDGVGPYAGVVMFAGEILPAVTPNQTRFSDSLKFNFASYLEARNKSANAAGNNDYQTSATAAPPFNDILYCINVTLAVAACP